MIGAEIDSWEEKNEIMENKSKLKGVRGKIYIENDLTVQERNVRRILLNKAKDLRESGSRVKIGYYWIEIDGKRLVYDEKRKIPGLVEESESGAKNGGGRGRGRKKK